MSTIIKKGSFVNDGNGNFTRSGHIEPKTADGTLSKVDTAENAPSFSSSDENVFTVAPDPNDPLKFILTWVAAGTADLQVTADADLDAGEQKQITGAETFKLEEEEADSITVVLD